MFEPEYPFRSSEHERQRLMRQADMLSEATERLFRKAGIGPGMRVLDVGSGAGDVALLARRLVGETGKVIGTDRDEAQVAFASRRAQSLGYANVRFFTSDYPSLVLDAPVDAIVGRLVLLFARDPVASLVGVCRNLRSGGIVAFHENNMQFDAPVLVEPRDGLAGKVAGWIIAGIGHSGVQPRLGLKLYAIMKTAGLEPSPQIEATMVIAQGPEGALFPYLCDLVRSAMPSIIASGAATAAEIDIDTLEQRLVADAPTSGVVGTISAGFVRAWPWPRRMAGNRSPSSGRSAHCDRPDIAFAEGALIHGTYWTSLAAKSQLIEACLVGPRWPAFDSQDEGELQSPQWSEIGPAGCYLVAKRQEAVSGTDLTH